jgi:hypothetical protein
VLNSELVEMFFLHLFVLAGYTILIAWNITYRSEPIETLELLTYTIWNVLDTSNFIAVNMWQLYYNVELFIDTSNADCFAITVKYGSLHKGLSEVQVETRYWCSISVHSNCSLNTVNPMHVTKSHNVNYDSNTSVVWPVKADGNETFLWWTVI